MFRSTAFFCLIGLLVFSSGCQQFRDFFSRGSSDREERREERRERRTKRRERRRTDDDRDPVRDMFKIKDKPGYMHDKYLSPEERAILQDQLNSNDPSEYKKSFRSNYKDEQKKRQDWVFGR